MSNKQEYICEVCEIVVCGSRDEHCSGKKHTRKLKGKQFQILSNYTQTLKLQGSRKQKNRKKKRAKRRKDYYCEICKVIVSGYKDEHNQGIAHRKGLQNHPRLFPKTSPTTSYTSEIESLSELQRPLSPDPPPVIIDLDQILTEKQSKENIFSIYLTESLSASTSSSSLISSSSAINQCADPFEPSENDFDAILNSRDDPYLCALLDNSSSLDILDINCLPERECLDFKDTANSQSVELLDEISANTVNALYQCDEPSNNEASDKLQITDYMQTSSPTQMNPGLLQSSNSLETQSDQDKSDAKKEGSKGRWSGVGRIL